MQKITQFLEKNVEWVAVGAGVLFLLWMAYLYLLLPPVSKKVGETIVTPDNVEQWIDQTAATPLKNKINDAKAPAFNVDDFTNAIANGLDLNTLRPTELADAWDFHPIPSENLAYGPQKINKEIITAMPVLPVAKPLLVSSGQSTVMNNAAPNPVRTDLDWITGAFVIPATPLLQQWTLCYGPSNPKDGPKLQATQLNTWFLAVTAWRSEKLANGNWSDEVQVKPLFNIQLQDYPAPNNRNAEGQYVLWANRQMSDISTPAFPTQAAAPSGTVWKDPVAILHDKLNPPAAPAAPAAAPQTRVFFPQSDSSNFVTVAGPGGGSGGGPPWGSGPPPGMRIPPMQRPTPQAPPPDQAPTPSPAPVVLPAPSTDPNVVMAPGPNPTVAPTVLTNSFNPGAFAKDSPDIVIWFNDGTAQPGMTYRYRVEYKLLNPLFNKAKEHVAKEHEAWVNQLDLSAGKSDFSPEITVPQRIYFYCAKANPPTGLNAGFPFEVFTWADGLWRKQTFSALPGDLIGGTANNYDFSTGYTYVDGARRYNKFFVTVVDESGTTYLRDVAKDANSSDHKTRTQLVDQQTAAAAATPAAPDNGGANPGAPTFPVPPQSQNRDQDQDQRQR
jgi:hypothetical protein